MISAKELFISYSFMFELRVSVSNQTGYDTWAGFTDHNNWRSPTNLEIITMRIYHEVASP